MNSSTNNLQIQKLSQGDDTTIKLLYDKLFPRVVIYVGKNRGSYEDAKEIFQKALFEIIVRIKTKGLEIQSTFEGYIFTVCKNLWLQELNAKKKRVRNDDIFELIAEEDMTIASIVEQERWELFEEKLKLLSDNCRKLLKDFFNKVPYNAIVKKFNYSNENVAFQRVFKCKKRLTDLVQRDNRYGNLF